MSEYSDHSDVCKDNVENNFDGDLDLSGYDQLIYELENPNGRASVAPPERNEAVERAELEQTLADIKSPDDEEPAPEDKSALAPPDMREPDRAEAERRAAIRAEAYEAQDEAITTARSSSAAAIQIYRRRQAADAERSRQKHAEREAERHTEREAKKAANAERRRQKHAERERERRRAAREARATIPVPSITAAQSRAIRDEAKQRAAELIGATSDPASPERVRRLRGQEIDLMTWLIAWRVASLKTAAHRKLVPSLKAGPSGLLPVPWTRG